MTPPPLVANPLPDGDEWELIEAASSRIRAWCRWHIAPVVEETIVLDGSGTGVLMLPSRHVVEVLSLSVNGQPVTGFEVAQSGWIRAPFGVFPDRLGAVSITLRHGYESAPAEVVHVVRGMKSRAAEVAAHGGIVSEGTDSFTVAYGRSAYGGAADLELLPTDRAQLAPYRVPVV